MKKKQEKQKRTVVLSFRTDADVQKLVDRNAKKQKQTRNDFLETLVIAALQPAEQTA